MFVDPGARIEIDQRAGQPFVDRFEQLRLECRAFLVEAQRIADNLAVG